VRSRIIEGLLNQRYPHFEVRSFGTDVDHGGSTPQVLIREMSNWGIEISKLSPTSVFNEIDFIKSSNLVISADDNVSSRLAREGIHSFDICDFAVDDLHVPLDPVNFPHEKFFVNAAKVIHCTARMLSHMIQDNTQSLSIRALTSVRGDNFPALQPNSIHIDAGLRRTLKETELPDDARLFVESEIFDGSIISSLKSETRFYSPKYEFSQPERILLSEGWSNFVKEVSKFGEVVVITTPLNANRRQLWDPFLASIVADEVVYI
jgi:protein-tyrosine-phosphatase